MHRHFVFLAALSITLSGFQACSDGNVEEETPTKQDSLSKKTAAEKQEQPVIPAYQRPPIVNIVEGATSAKIIIYCKDSAASFEGMRMKIERLQSGKLAEYIKKNSLKTTSAPVAWIRSNKAPYFFETGIPVNKTGKKTEKGILTRELRAGNAVIAHFFGPYDMLPQGYEVIEEFIKDNNKRSAGAPYEIYVSDSTGNKPKPTDPYKVQTDIVFPVK